MKFTEEVRALFGQYKSNIKLIRDETTKEFFTIILRKISSNQIIRTTPGKIQIGKFYIIKYNFNGNKLWCPLLTIPPLPNKNEEGILERQLKLINSKKILYAVNFDYLPIKYKAKLIEFLIKNNYKAYERNSDIISTGNKTKDEIKFNVDWIYLYLKKNENKNYAVTAYDIYKILEVYEVSSVLARFVFFDTYYVNKKLMLDVLNNITVESLRSEFNDKLKIYDEILKMYEEDIDAFTKSLRNFEKNLKLFENI
jgi:hypothetical protein